MQPRVHHTIDKTYPYVIPVATWPECQLFTGLDQWEAFTQPAAMIVTQRLY